MLISAVPCIRNLRNTITTPFTDPVLRKLFNYAVFSSLLFANYFVVNVMYTKTFQ